MPLPFALPSIRPISDLRTKLNEVEAEAKETREPIVMTKNGVASLVVIDSSAYEDRLQHERAVRKLREAEIEAKYISQTIAHDQMKLRIATLIEAAERCDA